MVSTIKKLEKNHNDKIFIANLKKVKTLLRICSTPVYPVWKIITCTDYFWFKIFPAVCKEKGYKKVFTCIEFTIFYHFNIENIIISRLDKVQISL